jgi:hypothetical protein
MRDHLSAGNLVHTLDVNLKALRSLILVEDTTELTGQIRERAGVLPYTSVECVDSEMQELVAHGGLKNHSGAEYGVPLKVYCALMVARGPLGRLGIYSRAWVRNYDKGRVWTLCLATFGKEEHKLLNNLRSELSGVSESDDGWEWEYDDEDENGEHSDSTDE